jgi:hypothetical protein
MQYNMYQFALSKMAMEYRRINGLRKKDKTAIAETIRTVLTSPIMQQTVLSNCVIDELGQIQQGNHAIFIEDMKLLEMIETANFEIDAESFDTPHESFLVCFPRESGLPGCLVTYQDFEKRQGVLNKINKEHGHNLQLNRADYYALCINHSTGEAASRAAIPVDKIPECLASPEDMSESIGNFDMLLVSELSDEDKAIQHRLLRIVAGLSVYARAFPGAIRSGYPSEAGKKLRDRYLPSPEVSTAQAPKRTGSGTERKEHYRTWHFRTLRDDRYKRDKDGRPKIVFVRDTIVGGEVIPETAVEK